jgi:putative hemolysin
MGARIQAFRNETVVAGQWQRTFLGMAPKEAKMNRNLLLIFFLSLALVTCTATESNEPVAQPTEVATAQPTEQAGLPNPASVYCEAQGYEVEMREGEGGTYGVCLFPDGSECDEWAYFRGECQPGESLGTPLPVPEATAELAADGCQLYQNEVMGFQFHYPADAVIEYGNDPQQAVSVVGPLVDDEKWPMIYVSYPADNAAYRPPDGVDLAQWLQDHDLLMTAAQDPPAEVRQPDVPIAGATAVHTRFERSPQSYAYDKYFFTHGDRLFVVVIVHTGDQEDWDLYNHFLQSFQFVS